MTKSRFSPSVHAIWRALLLFPLAMAILSAQEYRARVQGTVKDTTDAVIPGASVTLSIDRAMSR